jgi:hypothetical protein
MEVTRGRMYIKMRQGDSWTVVGPIREVTWRRISKEEGIEISYKLDSECYSTSAQEAYLLNHEGTTMERLT